MKTKTEQKHAPRQHQLDRKEWYKKYRGATPEGQRQMRAEIFSINLNRWNEENKSLELTLTGGQNA